MNGGHFIDSHVHIWPPHKTVVPECFTAEDFLSIAGPAGVRRAVLVQPSLLGYDNGYMLEAIRTYPGVLGAVAMIDLNADGAPRQMDRLVAAGVRGFRLLARGNTRTWLDSRAMLRAWNCAAELEAAIDLLVDPGDLPAVREMCFRFPATRVVIDHLARIGMDGHLRETDLASLCALSVFPNAYVKISGFYSLGKRKPPYRDLDEMITRVLAAFRPERLMWGSDAPFQLLNGHRYEDSLDFIVRHAGTLRTAGIDHLLGQTAGRLLFPPPSQD